VDGSTLELYRRLLRLRRELDLGVGELTWLEAPGPDVLAFRVGREADAVTVLANLGPEPVPLPGGAEVLVGTAVLRDGAVPCDAAVWLRG
jgi:alpha-glucosidase